MVIRRTRDVARELGVNALRLDSLIRYGKIRAPEKDSGGAFIWSAADISRAREAMRKMDEKRTKQTA